MTTLMEDPDLLELTVNRDEIDAIVLDSSWVAITGQNENGEYFRCAVEFSPYLDLVNMLEYDWSCDIVVPLHQVWGHA